VLETPPQTKVCTGPCKEEKPITEFADRPNGKFGKRSTCRTCISAYCKARYSAASLSYSGPSVTEKYCPLCKYTKPASEFQRRPNAPGGLHTYCSKCKGKTERFRKNVWSHERFVKGLEIQDHQCAVSGIALNEDDRHTHADHCHKGNFPRALLNAQINQALGKLKDSPPLLCLKLVAYAWAWGGEMPANATVVLAEEMVKQRGIRLEYERFEAQMALPQAA
jgi:hypothetical protein